MDKYDERAMEWCPDELDHQYHTDKKPCKAIAAALREAAAEAFTEAANAVEKAASESLRYPDGGKTAGLNVAAVYLAQKAAALARLTPGKEGKP